MKKILILLLMVSFAFIACEKPIKTIFDKKGTRLKTYTSYLYRYDDNPVDFSNGNKFIPYYNGFNKIDSVQILNSDDAHIATYRCIYNADKTLDSIYSFSAIFGVILERFNVECDGNGRIILLDTQPGTASGKEVITYNSDGTVHTESYNDIVLRYEYFEDSVNIYEKFETRPEVLHQKIKFSQTIKNPFYINQFDKEAYIMRYLIIPSWNLGLFPMAVTEIETIGKSTRTLNYSGSFNDYPLEMVDNFGGEEIFTYEEFKLLK
ncbi:MAG: hypothetical protein IPK18_05840 [Sphingobacteriales bacterium]|nr:MAG: hypothetical protein IPK18_05840 [Sphingobacteriales bacterium]